METNDSNIKPQQTGGLKLMTVFVFVIAAHVVVIGGVTAYYLMKGGSSDDILSDQSHKSAKVADAATAPDGTMSEASQADKNATASTSTPSADTASGAINAPTLSVTPTTSTDSGAISTGTSSTTAPIASSPVQQGPVITPPQPSAKTTIASSPMTTPEAQPPVTVNGMPYVVKSGDSLARIARQNHTSVAKLKAANSLTSDMLHIGQKMVIPARTQVAATSSPAANADASATTTILGDSPMTPSMSVPAPAATAPVVHHQAAPMTAAAGHGHTYTVVKGDTLTKIAHKFKTTPTAIMTENSITDAAKLSIGKKLRIPGQEARSATNNEPVVPIPAAAQSQPNQAPAKAETTAQLANFVQ